MQDGFEQLVCVPDLHSHHPIQFVGWLVSDQVQVIAGERIAEVMCDGCVVHIESPGEGVIRLEAIHPQSIVNPGELLCRLGGD